MPMPDLEGAAHYACDRLAHELSPLLIYHSLAHTRDDVVIAGSSFAAHSGLNRETTLLVQTAAWYHDLGFVVDRNDHETHSITIARAILPQYDYTPRQIDLIAGMIAATRLPQAPKNLCEQILADADLDVLGRDDFLGRNQSLRDETAAYGRRMSDAEWYTSQLAFMRTHSYWTAAARTQRNSGKQRNIALLAARLATLNEVS